MAGEDASQLSEFYAGSQLLLPLANVTGLNVSKINFLVGQIAALLIGIVFRKFLSASKTSPQVRHVAELLVGLCVTYFCFGHQMVHLFAQGTICYLIIVSFPSSYMHTVCFFAMLFYLVTLHSYRYVYAYLVYELDITGPIMVSTQRFSALALALHDGMHKKPEKLSADQREQAIHKVPSLLELFSYTFSFHGVLIGPMCFYNDYIAFIEGTNRSKGTGAVIEDMAGSVWLKKSAIAVISLVVTLGVCPFFPAQYFTDSRFDDYNVFGKMFYILVTLTLMRSQFYFAWLLGELVNNAAGLGFNGYDKDGKEKWDLLTNADIWQVETCLTIRDNVASWNTLTALWLRRTVYDRVSPAYNVWATYAVSSLWHGVYPGYYIAFFTTGLFVVTARTVRRNIRPYFQTSQTMKFAYDCLTCIMTRMANVYMVIPFVVLELFPTFSVFFKLYFWMHVMSFLALLCLPGKKPVAKSE